MSAALFRVVAGTFPCEFGFLGKLPVIQFLTIDGTDGPPVDASMYTEADPFRCDDGSGGAWWWPQDGVWMYEGCAGNVAPAAETAHAIQRPLNLTPHDVIVILPSGERVTFLRSGRVARAVTSPQADRGVFAGVPIVSEQVFTGTDGIEPDDGDVIVSFLVAPLLASHPGRVFVPDTGPGQAVRDESGQIVGVKRLIEYPRAS